jgi:hypothetical protein
MRNYDFIPDDRPALIEEIARQDERIRELEGKLSTAHAALTMFVDHAEDKEATERWKWLNDCYFAACEALGLKEEDA